MLVPAAANASIGLARQMTYLGSLEDNKGVKRAIVDSMLNALLSIGITQYLLIGSSTTVKEQISTSVIHPLIVMSPKHVLVP